MSKKRKELSHAEYYHSLHARGEKVEDVLRAADAAEDEADVELNGSEAMQMDNEDGEQGAGDFEDVNENDAEDGEIEVDVSDNGLHEEMPAQQPAIHPNPAAVPGLPQALIGSGHDEGMRNLMMSWYHAGYYTGFYEGQKQAEEATRPTPPGVQMNDKHGRC